MASTFFVMKMYFVWRTLCEEETLFQNTLVFYDSHAPIAVCSRELAALQLRHAPQTSLACCIMTKTSLSFCEHEFSSSATVCRQIPLITKKNTISVTIYVCYYQILYMMLFDNASDFSLPHMHVTSSSANGMAVPMPRLVVMCPSVTTGSVEMDAPVSLSSNPG